MLTLYTTYADVRAALGVDDDELTDATLGLQLYADSLDADLRDIGAGVASTYATVSALSSPTADQSWFIACVRSFSTYAVARALLPALPSFAPQSIEDGKARVQRFDTPYREKSKAISEEMGRWQSRLEAAFTGIGQAANPTPARRHMSVVTPGRDPIDRKSTRLNSSHHSISYAVFCLKKKK